MPLVDRQVDRLADRAAGVMQRVRHVGELHEVTEILDARVTPAFIDVADEGRPVGGRKNGAIAADHDAARRVACVLHEFLGSRAGDDGAAHPAGKAHALALDVGACVTQDLQRLGVIAEVDADLFEDRVRIVLEQLETLGAQHLVIRDVARYVRDGGVAARSARGTLGVPAARTARAKGLGWLLVHGNSAS